MEIENTYLSYEVSMLLKKKGFKVECDMYWWKSPKDGHVDTANTDYHADFNEDYVWMEDCLCSCPTHQLVLKWLREIHGYEINIMFDPMCNSYRDYEYKRFSDWKSTSFKWFDTWEDCTEWAIKNCLNFL